MNTKLTKLISSAAVILAVGSSAYAQNKVCPPTAAPSFEQGYGLSGDKFPAAYNAAARIDVQNSWDFYLSGSFLYWHVDQEGMDIAYPTPALDNHVLVQEFKFKPGFKAALGLAFDYDNWVGAVEYTWLHQQTTMSATPPTGKHWYVLWFHPVQTAVTHLSTSWRSNFDIVDATLSRPYYEGKKLTILPFGGIRGAWIRQNLHVNATVADVTHIPVSHNSSHSWAVGPRAGFQGHWLLGWGFRLEGDVAGSALFTRYHVHHRETTTDGSELNSLSYHEYNTIRPMSEMNLGLGWGSYFDRQNYHFDLLATYDFNVLWGQNMMRSLISTYIANGTFQAADLHIQGLTLSARFDF